VLAPAYPNLKGHPPLERLVNLKSTNPGFWDSYVGQKIAVNHDVRQALSACGSHG
jgi:hypothetical protein